LHMMEIGNEQFYHDPLMRGTNDIQELSKTHDIVSKSKTELWHPAARQSFVKQTMRGAC
jgi:hypothetical protein